MNPVNILASDYAQRSDLESYIANELGDNIDANRQAGHTITGTADELKALGLSVNARIYGVKVVLAAQ